MSKEPTLPTYVTVCEECLEVACWAGVFMCEKAQTADILTLRKEQYAALDPVSKYADYLECSGTEEGFISDRERRIARADRHEDSMAKCVLLCDGEPRVDSMTVRRKP